MLDFKRLKKGPINIIESKGFDTVLETNDNIPDQINLQSGNVRVSINKKQAQAFVFMLKAYLQGKQSEN